MGVYVYRSLRADYIKVGHYAGQNAWSRVAHRGFKSCKRPAAVGNLVSVNDVELIAWFPRLTKEDEKNVKKKWRVQRGGSEWYPELLRTEILAFLHARDDDEHFLCSREAALATRKRL